jgi:membrane-bound serine protease (ClpP class)
MKLRMQMLLAGMLFSAAVGRSAENSIALIELKGAIGPATPTYISRAIDTATKQNNACLVIQLDTPGGLVSSTKDIVDLFYASKVPVVVYVAPAGAGATSAGTFITMAADIAAMAPNTRIGAAHPVEMGMSGGETTNDIMHVKVENDLSSFIRTIADKRGRNSDWAESAVRESASITSEKALKLKVIDLIAKDLPDLLRQIDGRKIGDRTLRTAGADTMKIPMAPRERLFQMIWGPEVMFLLMLAAIYGIIGEINNPGAVLPGVAGAIALVLFLYMSTRLPINIAGIALILLALVLFIIDLYSPTHGVLTAGGILAFFLGALMLFNHAGSGFHLSLGYIIPATLLTAAFFVFGVAAGLRAQRLPAQVGRETMIGKAVPAVERIDAAGGKVFVEGEYWNAVSDVAIEKGRLVEIAAVEGLTLKVKPKS